MSRIAVASNWSQSRSALTLRVMDAELDGFSEKEQLWFRLNKVVNHWEEEIGSVCEDGWISHDRYEEAASEDC